MNQENSDKKIDFRPPAKLLVIDDSHLNRDFIVKAFYTDDYSTITAENGEEGLRLAHEQEPELILLDIMMPDMDGFETCRKMKENPKTADIPIIFITALDAVQDKLKAFEVGGVDFVTKPFNHKELKARVKTHVSLKRANKVKSEMLKIALQEKRHEAITRIAAGISHNFNNLLSIAFGNIDLVTMMIKDQFEQTKDLKGAVTDVRTSLERMYLLVQKFIALTKSGVSRESDSEEPVNVKLHELLDEVIDNIRNQKIALVTTQIINSVGQDARILCDSNQASEIFHLIFNEILDISSLKGIINVTSETLDNHQTSVTINIKNMRVPFKMSDTVFEPFALPLANVGSGLSFAVAKRYIEENGGKILAKNVNGNEVNFELLFKN